MTDRPHSYNPQAGSALIFILIGVSLFGALGFAIANIVRTGDPNIIGENQAELFANEIMDYAVNLRGATQALKINGCGDQDISFENDIVSGYEHSPVADNTCKVFHPDGTGMNYVVPPEKWLDVRAAAQSYYGEWYFAANVCVPDIGTSGSGTGCINDGLDNEDIIVFLPYIKRVICEKINAGLGITGIPAETGNAWPPAGTQFTGAQSDGERLDVDGRLNGCFEGRSGNTPGNDTYHFFQVLVAR